MVFVIDKPWVAQKSKNETPLGTLPGANSPDNIAPGITEPLKLLIHVKVAIHGGFYVYSYSAKSSITKD